MKSNPITYNSIEEKRDAFRKAIAMRHVWENEMRKRIAELDAKKQAAL